MMLNYLYIAITFIIGWVCGYLFTKFVKLNVQIKINDEEPKGIHKQSPEIDNISEMLTEIREKGKINIPLSPTIFNCIKEIANTPNWEEQIDSETIQNLTNIYKKWKRHNAPKNKTVAKIGQTNFKKTKYWEGTLEELKIAIQEGKIDDNTEINVIYDDSEPAIWYSVTEQGTEEFME